MCSVKVVGYVGLLIGMLHVLAACSDELQRSDVVGNYTLDDGQAKAVLSLADDGTYKLEVAATDANLRMQEAGN